MKLFVSTGLVGVALFAAAPLAHANEDPNANPPNCSAADLEGAAVEEGEPDDRDQEVVKAGVQAATSAYLFTHPDVNDFFDTLEGLNVSQRHSKIQAYMAANPQTAADLTGIRQPLVDVKNRCGQG